MSSIHHPAAPGPHPRGCFIVFEGLDGSGTSTQARLLHERLQAGGVEALLTAEPTDGPVGRLVRSALQHRVRFDLDEHRDEQQMSYLFAADRFHHLHNRMDGVLALRERGVAVICARYVWSSFAYNCRSEADVERVARLNAGFPPPDLTFYIDVPVETSLSRIDGRGQAGEKYETAEKLRLVHAMYLRARQAFPCEHRVLDGTLVPEAQHAHVWSVVHAMMAPGA